MKVLDVFKTIETHSDFIEIIPNQYCLVDIKYASTDNFMNADLYNGYRRAFLHTFAFAKFKKALDLLTHKQAGHKLVIFDSFRPKIVQQRMWEYLKGTEHESYVASPERGSLHNYGLAIDLSIVDSRGVLLDMGTAFDEFTELAQPQKEKEFLKQGLISANALANRQLLKEIMEGAGFKQLPWEWWHFDAVSRSELSNFSIY